MKPSVLATLFVYAVMLFADNLHAKETPAAAALPKVGFSIIKTGKVSVVERLLLPDGSLTKKIDSNFAAFLVKHHQSYLLFDTGLGKHIETQYEQDMAYWRRLFFRFDKPVVPARKQLDDAGFAPIEQVFISHSHWDHASGVVDFPEARIMASPAELSIISGSGTGGAWPSQVSAASINWRPIVFKAVPYKGYAQSLDLFNDGSVVLVPMPGHTAGSMGMFVTVDSGKCYFFIGDVAWKAAAVKAGAKKFWAAHLITDHDREQTTRSVLKVHALMAKEPGLVVVPAHDAAVHDTLGYFPRFVK